MQIRMLPAWLHRKTVLVQTLHSFFTVFCSVVMTPFAVSSSCLQVGMLSGCCFHTQLRSTKHEDVLKPYNYLYTTTKIPSSLGTVLLSEGPPKGRCAGVVKHWSHNRSPSGTSVRFTQSLHILSTRRCEVIYICVIIAFWVVHRVCSCASFHTSETTCHTSRKRACSSLLPQ